MLATRLWKLQFSFTRSSKSDSEESTLDYRSHMCQTPLTSLLSLLFYHSLLFLETLTSLLYIFSAQAQLWAAAPALLPAWAALPEDVPSNGSPNTSQSLHHLCCEACADLPRTAVCRPLHPRPSRPTSFVPQHLRSSPNTLCNRRVSHLFITRFFFFFCHLQLQFKLQMSEIFVLFLDLYQVYRAW